MPTSQSQLTATLREQIEVLEEKCPGYRAKAADTLAKIIAFEYQNKIRPIAIRQEVKKQSLALGSFLAERLPNRTPEGAESTRIPE